MKLEMFVWILCSMIAQEVSAQSTKRVMPKEFNPFEYYMKPLDTFLKAIDQSQGDTVKGGLYVVAGPKNSVYKFKVGDVPELGGMYVLSMEVENVPVEFYTQLRTLTQQEGAELERDTSKSDVSASWFGRLSYNELLVYFSELYNSPECFINKITNYV